jgi:uncharacterized membrane protein
MKNGLPNRIDSILSSLDQVQRASAPDYLYTRIKGRLQREDSNASTIWILRPVPLIGMLLVFLVINASLIWSQKNIEENIVASSEGVAPKTEVEVPYAVAAEYSLHDNVTFYDNGREISSR